MSFAALAFAVVLIAYGAAMFPASLVAAVLAGKAIRIPDPASRSRAVLALRFLPALLGLATAGLLVLPAFLRYEPRDTTEVVSLGMAVLAGGTAAVLLTGLVRGLWSFGRTRSLVNRWRSGGRPIDVPGIGIPAFLVENPFPLVSIAGAFRPRLYIAPSVLAHCERDELAAVIAHELGHLRRRDPLIRFLVRSCPDVLSLTRSGDRLERAWAEAAEQLADDDASRSRPGAALDLASALVKVARLVRRSEAPDVPLLALYRGEGVAVRVARLLDREEFPCEGARRRWPSLLPLLAGGGAVSLLALLGGYRSVHALIEAAVTFLQ